MKKKLFAIAFVSIFAACGNNPKTTDSTTTISDTANNTMTDKSKTVEMNGMSDTIISSDGSKFAKVDPNGPAPVIDAPVVKHHSSTAGHSTVKHHTGNSGNTGSSTTTNTTNTTSTTGTNTNGNNGTVGTQGTGTTTTTETTPTTTQPEKKGWSKAAKGAAIGGASGAVIGAVVSKNKGVGAVVGGVVGAGAGYLFGRKKDKKDGRVDTTKQ